MTNRTDQQNDRPEHFVITMSGMDAIVERHIKLDQGDTLSYRIKVKAPENDAEHTIFRLHQQSADAVIRFLLQYLPEGFDQDYPYRAGPKRG